MMASPAITYSSPSDSHTPIGSPAPSQILLHRVASPNHLASQHVYVDSPRSVPMEYSQQYSVPTEQHFDYEQSPEMYVNEDPHIYDLGPNGALPMDPQFVQPQIQQSVDANNLMFMVLFHFIYLSLIKTVNLHSTSTTHSYARTICESRSHTS